MFLCVLNRHLKANLCTIFYLLNIMRIFLIICRSNFISFGPVESILEPSEDKNLCLANPVLLKGHKNLEI